LNSFIHKYYMVKYFLIYHNTKHDIAYIKYIDFTSAGKHEFLFPSFTLRELRRLKFI